MKGSIERFENFLVLVESGNYTKNQICEILNIDVRTFYRYVNKAKKVKNIDIKSNKNKVYIEKQSEDSISITKDLKQLINLSVEAAESYIDFFLNSPELIKAKFNLKFKDNYIEIHKQPICRLNSKQKYFMTKLYDSLLEDKDYFIYNMKYLLPNGEEKEYCIVPYKIVFKRRAWYVLALDCIENYKAKIFRVNRILDLRKQNCTIDYNVYKDNVKDLFKNAWEFYGGEEIKKVRLKVHKEEIWTYLTEVDWHRSQINDNKNRVIEFSVAKPQEMLPFILQYAEGIEILEPIELKQEYLNILNNAIMINSDT
ncbi:WYL domain-containing protein [Thermobrachium celere]|uniref:Transcription regulator n=1 Tax=Thermobrachium celere DSM 8682 TaxID=941824 RepID=R7RUL9_9CLOT|nr:WYL domain-containing protein [Thermobrachium celere]CDF59231.1 transcription regulator [Thermobrachium celere DSM 8682]